VLHRADAAKRPVSEDQANEMAAAVWRNTWPIERLQQRAFFNFGMEVRGSAAWRAVCI
jgi:hypothetical protein